jgi:hypothetical protein
MKRVGSILVVFSVVALFCSELLADRAGYMRGSSPPWGSNSNEAAMTAVFGAGNWEDLRFAGGAGPFAVGGANDFTFLYLDGSDGGAVELSNYLSAHGAAIQAWVEAGGRLFLNAAPNVGGGFSMGFGVTLTYPDPSPTAVADDAAHPIFNEPVPVGSSFSGNSISHATVAGASMTSLMRSSLGRSVLGEQQAARGRVLFGGLTTSNFHAPQPQASQLRANIISYAATGGDSDGDGMPDAFEEANGLDPEDPSDALADLDDDGLTNLEEFIARTLILNADTDGDGLSDGTEVKTSGTDPRLADTDGDGAGDAGDPYPLVVIQVGLELPFGGLITAPVTVRCTLRGAGGALVADPIRFTLSVTGSAVFASAAAAGAVISGGGTSTVELESSGGVVEIQLSDSIGEAVTFAIADSAGIGLRLGGLSEDAESGENGWTHQVLSGSASDWRISSTRAASGSRSWHSGPASPGTGDAVLVSPEVNIGGAARLEFRHWYAFDDCNDPNFIPDGGVVELRVLPGGAWTRLSPAGGYPRVLNHGCANPLGAANQTPAYTGNSGGAFIGSAFDLAAYAGQSVQVRFRAGWDCGNCFVREGWYVDDISIGFTPGLTFLSPGGDADGDSLSNAVEIERGTHPLRPDTDADGLRDAVEDDTGVFLDLGHTGTDPLDFDTDGDGVGDGDELARSLDPHNADTDDDGLQDGVETDTGLFVDATSTGTDPLVADTDGDAVEDGAEVAAGLNPLEVDSDFDGIADGADLFPRFIVDVGIELPFAGLTSTPARLAFRLRDPDGNAIAGPAPVRFTIQSTGVAAFSAGAAGTVVSGGGTNRALVETSAGVVEVELADALPETIEISVDDSEGVGLASAGVVFSFLEPLGDDDGDGLSNEDEFGRETDPFNPDTDGDGLTDGVESGTGVFVDVGATGTDPRLADSDGDGVADGVEVDLGSYPTDGDSVPAATVMDFTSAPDPQTLVLNGTAAHDGGLGTIVLTEPLLNQAGSAFFAAPVNLQSLELGFDLRISSPGGVARGNGADGLAMAVVGAPTPEILGGPGGGLGVAGLPYPTLVVAADTWQNPSDVSNNHFEAHYYPSGVPFTDNLPGFAQNHFPFDLRDGRLYRVEVSLSAPRLQVTVTPEGEFPFQVLDVEVPGFTPFTGFLGFTASTGSDWERHEVDNVRILSRPVDVASVEPAAGGARGGTAITVHGRGFIPGATALTVGGEPASAIVVVDPSTLTAVTPAHGAGPAAVQVFVPGFTAGLAGGFTFTPFIEGVAPRFGLEGGGQQVAISGLGFIGGTQVAFGGAPSPEVIIESPTRLLARTPPGSGAAALRVSNADGEHRREGAFRYLPEGGDLDGDGSSNAAEIARGTQPDDPDSDDDGLVDAVETGSGIFIDESDTGTDPLNPDTDGGGLFDGGEIELGTDPFDPGDDLQPGSLPVFVVDGGGFFWDVYETGYIGDGTNDAFDGGMFLSIGGVGFPPQATARFGQDNQLIVIGPAAIGGLQVTRQLFIPRTGGSFARYVEVLENPSGQDVQVSLVISGNLGSDGSTFVMATSSGDQTVSAADDWFVTDDGIGGDPTMGFVLADPQALTQPENAGLSGDNFFYSYDVLVPAGGMAAVLHFASQSPNVAGATAKARELIELSGRAREHLSADVLAHVVNFSRDSDGDGIPDPVETAAGLDPEDPADAAGDLDGDGLSNVAEFRLGTSLVDADTDDDGLADGAEVAAGLDPRSDDSDGDGAPDGSDPFPKFRAVVAFSGPAVALAGGAARLRAEIRGPDGAVLSSPPLRFSLRSTAGARFAAGAAIGTVISGGGSADALVETAGGVVAIDVVAAAAGNVTITAADTQSLGIEGPPSTNVVYRINCGSFTPYTDSEGRLWSADNFFLSGQAAEWPGVAISNADDPMIYRSERWGDAIGNGEVLVYSFPVNPGRYLVNLHFAEVCECILPPNPPRIFNLDVEGQRVLTDFNTIDELGGWRVAGERTLEVAVADSDLRLDFSGGSFGHLNPKISGIEVIDRRPAPATHSLRVLAGDGDGDGDRLSNADELRLGTDVDDPDTDADGLLDGFETGTGVFAGGTDAGTDPTRADSDGDGLPDGLEVRLGTSPVDGASRAVEIAGDAVLSGERLEVGIKPDNTLITAARRGILLKETGPSGPAPDLLGTVSSNELFAIKYIEGGFNRSVVNGAPGPHLDFRSFDGGDDESEAVIGVSQTGPIAVRQELRVGAGDSFARLHVTVTNISAGELRNVRYLRSANPTIGNAATLNDVAGGGVVLASGASGATLLMGAVRPPGIASAEGQRVTDPDVVIGSPADPNSQNGDLSLNLAFSLGDLLPGRSAELELVYAAGISREAAENAFLLSVDSDGDGIPDGIERRLGLDPLDGADAAQDFDGDGLSNLEEYRFGSAIFAADSDGDGLLDGDESEAGSNPLVADSDADGLEDGEEPLFETAIVDADTDGDGFGDGLEFRFGGDPSSAVDLPVFSGALDFDGAASPAAIPGFLAAGSIALADGRVQLPASNQPGVGGLYNLRRLRGDYLIAAFEMEVVPGSAGRGDGVTVALIGAPAPGELGACCRGAGIAGITFPLLAVEIDLTQHPGEPAAPHIGVDYFPEGLFVTQEAVASQATALLPAAVSSGGVFRFEIELAAGTLRVHFGGASGDGGAAFERQLVLEHSIDGYARIDGYAAIIGGSGGPNRGTHAIDNLILSDGGPVGLEGVAPAFGPLAGGTEATIAGRGFAAGASVFVGAREAEVLELSEDAIEIAVPAGESPGPKTVYVVSPGGGARLPGAFTYTPYLRGVSPASGPLDGGVRVRILGAGFQPGALPAIAFGGAAASEVTFISETILQVRVPPGVEGLADVRAGDAASASTLRGAFRYVPAVFVPRDHATIQAAIDAAPAGGMVVVAAGRHNGSIDLRDKGIELRSLEGPDRTTIQSGAAGPAVRVPASGRAALRGFTVRGARGDEGSGILVGSQASVTLEDLIVSNNEGPGGRGITIGQRASFAIDRVVIESNRCLNGNGGGIAVGSLAQGTISNAVIAGNSATGQGGGIAVAEEPAGAVKISHVTVVNNIAGQSGGGVRLASSRDLLLANSILWDNQAIGGDADLDAGLQARVRFCDIENGPGAGQNGNVSVAPLFEDAAAGDFRLAAGSPLVDVGERAGAMGLAFDLDGLERSSDGDGDGVALPDLGAYERPAASDFFKRGDVNADGKVDISDGIKALGYLFLGEAAPACLDAADANDDGDVDISDATKIFGFLFLGEAELRAPGPFACGPDPSADRVEGGDLGCGAYAPCD